MAMINVLLANFNEPFPFSIDLMNLLVSSQDLCVIQTEFSLYVLLKLWLFLKLHPAWDGTAQEGITSAHQYFQNRNGKFYKTVDVSSLHGSVPNLKNHILEHFRIFILILSERNNLSAMLYCFFSSHFLLCADAGFFSSAIRSQLSYVYQLCDISLC